jgi:hypothetical protein
MKDALLLFGGAVLGVVGTILLSRLTPRLAFHPDIHWSTDKKTYRVRLRNGGHPLSRHRAGSPEQSEKRANHRWGHLVDLTVTATLVIRDGKTSNRHRIAIPVSNGAFAHLQPGDTRLLTLEVAELTDESKTILSAALASRDQPNVPDGPDLLQRFPVLENCYILLEGVGNDAWSGARRSWERRYHFGTNHAGQPVEILRTGPFPSIVGSEEVPCSQPPLIRGRRLSSATAPRKRATRRARSVTGN